jgi:hypothetical protein
MGDGTRGEAVGVLPATRLENDGGPELPKMRTATRFPPASTPRRAPAAPAEVYDVLRGRRIVGRIMLSNGSAASQWVWTISYHYPDDRTPTHGYEPTRDAAMKAFAKSWHRE